MEYFDQDRYRRARSRLSVANSMTMPDKLIVRVVYATDNVCATLQFGLANVIQINCAFGVRDEQRESVCVYVYVCVRVSE